MLGYCVKGACRWDVVGGVGCCGLSIWSSDGVSKTMMIWANYILFTGGHSVMRRVRYALIQVANYAMQCNALDLNGK